MAKKKAKAADDFADRMLETYTRQTDALERIGTVLVRIASALAIIADAPKPRRLKRGTPEVVDATEPFAFNATKEDVKPPTSSQTSR